MTDNQLRKNLGGNLTRTKWMRDMTTEALARRCGIAIQTVSRIESGQTFPRIRTIVEIAEVLGSSIDWLLRNPATIVHEGRESPGTPVSMRRSLIDYQRRFEEWHSRSNGNGNSHD